MSRTPLDIDIMSKTIKIFLNIIPVFIMIGLIPIMQNDYVLTSVYVAIIILLFLIKREKNEPIIFVFGFLFMIVSEYFFISTGVEIFNRNSLFGLMPLWLPFLWGYGFVVIKRCVYLLDSQNVKDRL